MSIVASPQRIASAYFVLFGAYGDVTRHAQKRGVCRQWLYREASSLPQTLARQQQTIERLHSRLRDVEQQLGDCQERLRVAVVLDAERQAQFASVAQACGVSLPVCWELLDVLLGGQQQSVATLGRATRAAGKRAGELLPILDALARQRAVEVAADEIYVKGAVLMMVEPESLCWLGGRLSGEVSGEAWARELATLPKLEQVTRDGGTGLAKGVALLNAQRQEHGQPAVVDQGDHYHALRGGSVGLRQAEAQARQAFAKGEAADKELVAANRQGQNRTGPAVRASFAWKKAEGAMDDWQKQEQSWQQTKEALRLFTPAGELNTPKQASAVLAEALSHLPDEAFAKVKRCVQKPEMLNYLERVQQQIEALPFPEELKQAALQQEGWRRRPELLQGESAQAAARRGVLLLCAVVLSKAGEVGQQAAMAVGDILRRAQRASSLVECINGVLRMQQARHRKMTQGLLDLKRLYWNCHSFRSGRRRGSTPYERLGVPWPEGLRWWDVLKMTPEQLQDKLSTATKAA
jgi:hypothetical protein